MTLNFYLLKPRKAKEFIPCISEELHLPQDLIEDVIDYYWREVRKNLSSVSHSRIHLTNLGDFTIKHWKLDEKIQMLEKWEENNKLKGMQELTARFKTAEVLYDLKSVKKLLEEENQRKEFIKLHKNKNNETRS